MEKQIIKNSIKEILLHYGLTPGKTDRQNWTCRSDRHNSPIGSLSLKNAICCCTCGIKGDSFNVIAVMENLDIKRDFDKIMSKAKDILNMSNGDSNIHKATTIDNKNIDVNPLDKINKITNYDFVIKYNLTDCITKAIKKQSLKDYRYYFNRGITNIKVLAKYRILSCNPQKVIPNELLPKLNNIWAYTNIIPVWKNQKVVNCILRRNDELSVANNKIYNLKGIPLEIFNLGYLSKADQDDIIFITEGIFDCLSFENYGMKSICLNSVTMYKRLIDSVKVNHEYLRRKNIKLMICLDNDEVGRRYANIIRDELRLLGIRNNIMNIDGYKDINEFLISDKKLFEYNLKKFKMIVDRN
jgi:hypothetical protein